MLFLGLDLSTQGLKCSVVAADEAASGTGSDARKLSLKHKRSDGAGLDAATATDSINFDRDLAQFGTEHGMIVDGLQVHQPTLMYFAALDMLFDRMKQRGFPFHRVRAVSGSAQQHGSVYWASGALDRVLRRLDPAGPLFDQLRDGEAFSTPNSPIWADSSTEAQCATMDKAFGGPAECARVTGSRATARFTGPQIAKVLGANPALAAKTERVSLISSAMATILSAAGYAAIDQCDGSGMNLLDISSGEWSQKALEATGVPGLAGKLGAPVPSHTVLGPIHAYFVQRFGFASDCQCVVWSGDNPNSFAGLGLGVPGDVGVSLGTSDTLFTAAKCEPGSPPPVLPDGHVFMSPVPAFPEAPAALASSARPREYMVMIVYKNGAVARELVRNRATRNSTWEEFDAALEDSEPGAGGVSGFVLPLAETMPRLSGTSPAGVFYNVGALAASDGRSAAVPEVPRDALAKPELEIRAVVESRFLSMRYHCEELGLLGGIKRLIFTGGASSSAAIVQVAADVFGVPCALCPESSDSASFGAAVRALHAFYVQATHHRGEAGELPSFHQVAEPWLEQRAPAREVRPNMEAHDQYRRMGCATLAWGRVEAALVAKLGDA